MAIYAFDGTWNEDDDLSEVGEFDTNVARFLDACDLPSEEEEYVDGIGTRFSYLGKTFGGAIGAGGRKRIGEMLDQIKQNFKNGDNTIDIIGFSRGAALALHFANEINDQGLTDQNGQHIDHPPIRFMGLWDTVAAFGIPLNIILPFQRINPGFKLGVPTNVGRCCHAMAEHERREAFMVTRLDPEHKRSEIEERWFRGVHSDVGGGNANTQLSNIALYWMLRQAADAGLPINPEKMKGLPSACDATAPISRNFDPLPDPSRIILAGDLSHPSRLPEELQPGQKKRFIVGAGEKYSWTGVKLVAGGRYLFDFDPGQIWQDGEIECGPAGWTVEGEAEHLNWVMEQLIGATEGFRRHADALWFEVVGTLGQKDEGCFRIGNGSHRETPYRAPHDAVLYAFANDLSFRYGNNKGQVTVAIERLADG